MYSGITFFQNFVMNLRMSGWLRCPVQRYHIRPSLELVQIVHPLLCTSSWRSARCAVRLSAFQADHIGCAKNRFQSIAQLVPCLTFFICVVVEQVHPVNFAADDMVLAKVDHFAADF